MLLTVSGQFLADTKFATVFQAENKDTIIRINEYRYRYLWMLLPFFYLLPLVEKAFDNCRKGF
ncbi:hypothetical protein PRABACTJOHN_02877 [Parabacteroides johnsonii DSM 18315]|uniref:Uncharacterized protein n=2 Tax=Parabacteroides johnsonii TaxID=387661 RepID=A0A9Q5STU9_9BACT|nr:hypothetical protein PRABACTJOHN_02877 [Parabacteroides johnsonii DSM 18315]OUO06657.1 hypothetical protein B5F96_02920 [Parabacteroides johnsonii]